MSLEDSLSTIRDLKLVWSKNPQKHNEGEYLIFMVDTRGKSVAPITERAVKSSYVEKIPSLEEYAVTFKLDDKGSEIWGEMTLSAAMNNKRGIAIIVGDRMLSCPSVLNPILSGSCQITGGFTREEAESLQKTMMIERYTSEFLVVSQDVKPLEKK